QRDRGADPEDAHRAPRGVLPSLRELSPRAGPGEPDRRGALHPRRSARVPRRPRRPDCNARGGRRASLAPLAPPTAPRGGGRAPAAAAAMAAALGAMVTRLAKQDPGPF